MLITFLSFSVYLSVSLSLANTGEWLGGSFLLLCGSLDTSAAVIINT